MSLEWSKRTLKDFFNSPAKRKARNLSELKSSASVDTTKTEEGLESKANSSLAFTENTSTNKLQK